MLYAHIDVQMKGSKNMTRDEIINARIEKRIQAMEDWLEAYYAKRDDEIEEKLKVIQDLRAEEEERQKRKIKIIGRCIT